MEISQITYDYIANECSSLYNKLIEDRIIPDRGIDNDKEKERIAFYYYMMNGFLDIKYSDIASFALFDKDYLEKVLGEYDCPDYGVDGCYISYESRTITLFNFKYWESLKERQKVDEIKSSKDFLDKIKSRDSDGLKGRILDAYNRIVDIIYKNKKKWNCNLYFITNDAASLPKDSSIIKEFKKQYGYTVKCFSLNEIYDKIISNNKKISCSISITDSNLLKFKTLSNNSFLYKINVLELFRMFCENEKHRLKYDFSRQEYDNIKNLKIDEQALYDNPRGDLRNAKFIKSISGTLTTNPDMFFAYNNGITILTNGIKEEELFGGQRIIYTLEDAQIVNGGQTVRACANAINSSDNLEFIKNADVLIRVFNIKEDENKSIEERKKQAELFRSIPKYTNKQEKITDKDLRAMDYVQFLIEKKLAKHRIFYCRRTQKDKSFDTNKFDSMIEMEKFGQIIFAKNGFPHLVSNKKKLIFDDEYDNIFTPLIDKDDFFNVVNDFNNLVRIHKELSQQKIFYIIYIKYQLSNYIDYDDCITLLNDAISGFSKLDNGEEMKESRKLIQVEFKDLLDSKLKKRNKIDNFINLIKSGFDVSFNYKDVFYTISLIDEDETGKKYGIGSDKGFKADFKSLESIPDFDLDDKKIKDIVLDLKDEEIFH